MKLMLHSDETLRSHILITDEVEGAFSELLERLGHERVVSYLREDFLIEDAKAVIAEAYISEERTKYLILGAKSFNAVSQNALLKVLEEPPHNIEFILIAPSKSIFLPTIRSRLPMVQRLSRHTAVSVDIALRGLDLDALFRFVKAHERSKKHDARALVEGIFHQAVVNERMILTPQQLGAFEKAYRLIGLNGRVQSILVMLLMTFLRESRRVS
jgi:DNA polymerase-3 subunit delta'